jgi:signal transduction histidine kinase
VALDTQLLPLVETIRSTAFRLAVRYVVFFALSTVTIFAITYHAAGQQLLNFFHSAISADTRELIAMSRHEDLAGLAEEIQERVSQGGANDDYYLLLGDDGRILAGNLAPSESFLGWREWERPIRPGSSENDHLIGFGTKLRGATLVVAQSVVAMRETQQVVLKTFGWGTLILIVLALAGGYAQSKGPVQRLREIAQTTRDIVDGQFDRRIATTGSLDDLDRLSLDINRMLDRIQDLMQSLKQVSSDIAHDLRTPIGRLRQELDTLQRNPGTLVDTQLAIDSVLREVDTIIDTFDALLRIAQIEGGARRANFQTVDMSAVLENVTGVYASVAEDRGHLFEVEIEKACYLRGDRDLLTQLFANLIENALTHVPSPSTITVTLKRTGSACRCVVADEGPGIPEEERHSVFRRLYRLERSRTTPGSGLGLSMVSAIAELHAATIRLDDNRPGLIATVIFDTVESPSFLARSVSSISQHGAQVPWPSESN